MPPPNAWGYTGCPGGGGSLNVIPVKQYNPRGRVIGSASVVCFSSAATSALGPPPPPPPPPSASQVWTEVPLPTPVLKMNPGTAGITQLPSWFWVADAGGPVSVTTSSGDYTVTATAVPVAYRWDFGDGAGALSDSSGGPGDPSVVHTYSQKGTYGVGVAVEYSGSFTFAGPGGTGSTALGDYWQPPVSTLYVVQEVRSVLVPSGDG